MISIVEAITSIVIPLVASLNCFNQESTQIIQYENKDIGRLTIEESEKKIIIEELHILPEFQGIGIGTKLMTI